MGLLKPYKQGGEEPDKAVPVEAAEEKSAKKQGPTPSRKEAEQARRERLHPNLSKAEIRARDRKLRAKERNDAMERAEKAPAKLLMRNYVDSRRGIAEWSLPSLLIFFAAEMSLSYIGGMQWATAVSIVVWVFIAVVGVELFLVNRGFKKLANERIPNESLRGVTMYGLSRAINIRRFRQPPPRVKPGDKI